MTNFGRRAAILIFAALTMTGMATGADAQNAAPPTLSTNLVRFTLPLGQVVTGRIVGFDGQMYSVQLPDGAMLVRKDYLIGLAPARLGRSPRRARLARQHKIAP